MAYATLVHATFTTLTKSCAWIFFLSDVTSWRSSSNGRKEIMPHIEQCFRYRALDETELKS